MRKQKINQIKGVAVWIVSVFLVGTNDQSREEFVGQAVEIVAVKR